MTILLLLLSLITAQGAGPADVGAISGQIRDVNGAPAAGIRVAATPVDGDAAAVNMLSRLGDTDQEGRYRLDAIPPGRYLILADAVSLSYFPGVTDRDRSNIVTVAAGQTLSNLDFTLAAVNSEAARIRALKDLTGRGRLPPGFFAETSGCTSSAVAPSKAIAADDFINFRRGQTQLIDIFNRRPDSVTIRGDGRLEWRMSASSNPHRLNWTGAVSIPAEDARSLIQRARSNGFWRLCASYSEEITESPSYEVTIGIEGQEKRVAEYGGGAPVWVAGLIGDLEAVVQKHVWIGGDPRKETFSDHQNGRHIPPTDLFNLRRDGLVPKPGVTDLMRAIAVSDAPEVRRLLSAGADVQATDVSGWTALMYAARNEGKPEIVSALLAAGANPNARSSMEQTPLMAAASGPLPLLVLLITAVTDINAQDKEGRTALMFAAQPTPSFTSQIDRPAFRAAVDRVSVLRAAGADANLKDADGFSASDQLTEKQRASRSFGGFGGGGGGFGSAGSSSASAEDYEAIRRALQSN